MCSHSCRTLELVSDMSTKCFFTLRRFLARRGNCKKLKSSLIIDHATYVENDPGEPEPLTPAHFLELGYGDSKYPIHFIELIDATTAKESYKKRKTYRTLLLKQLWRRWKEQYLLQLKTANHFKIPSVHKNLKLNDVVLVEGNVKSKLLWELEIIKEIFIGRDDNVRSCLVKTFKGLFKKPIQLLYPLEIV
ncbi:uncharacterized protein TNCV_1871221 [Trichonephila clavipes]|nr:uncharacterized protein TNCV_1871221 [Trichonephila clavipes]